MMKKISKKRKVIALYQILLLVSMSFAIAFILSESVGFASAQDDTGADLAVGIGAVGGVIAISTGIAAANAGFGATAYGVSQAFTGTLAGPISGALITGFLFAAVYVVVALVIADALGLSDEDTAAFVVASGVGGLTYGILLATLVEGATISALASFGISLIVIAVVFAILYKKVIQRKVMFQCVPWEAPVGGENCGVCNTDPDRPCTQYRCRALGQSCRLINEGTTHEACVWGENREDITAPVISPAPGSLSPDELSYANPSAVPPRGVQIKDSRTGSAECLQAWTRLEFGLNTDEPAKCAWSINRTDNIDQMITGFAEGVAKTLNHTLTFVIANNQSGADLSPILQSDGTFTYFVRCIDENGNANVDEFAVSFCIDETPDTSPPKVLGTLIDSGSFITFDATEIPFEVYTDEPANCKWSRNDQSFDNMENAMTCDADPANIVNLQYICSDTLTGLQNGVDNAYYFRCEDLNNNTMSQSYLAPEGFILKGSQPLNILSAGPNGTITGRASIVLVDLTVETDDGAQLGKAVCNYRSETSGVPLFTTMLETNSPMHTQPNLGLGAGTHEFEFRCVDAGGNIADESTTFIVEIDQRAPDVTRAYRQGDFLKIVTSEDAECVYNTQSCNYILEDGLPMSHVTPDDQNVHITQWETGANFYIKCQDELLNRPSPNDCSIIVKTVG